MLNGWMLPRPRDRGPLAPIATGRQRLHIIWKNEVLGGGAVGYTPFSPPASRGMPGRRTELTG